MGIQRCHALSRLADIAACHSLPAACQKLLNADLPAACQRLPKMQTCMQPFDMGRLRTLHAQVVLSQPSKRHTSSRPHLPAVLHAQVCIYGLHAHLPRVSIAHHHVDQKKKGILRKKEACKPLQAARRMSYSHVTLGLPIKCQTCLLMHCPALHQKLPSSPALGVNNAHSASAQQLHLHSGLPLASLSRPCLPAKGVKHAHSHLGTDLRVLLGCGHPQTGQRLRDAQGVAICQRNDQGGQGKLVPARQLLALPIVQQADVAICRPAG